MTDGQKYSDMPLAGVLAGSELVCVSQGGTSRQTTPNAFVTLASGIIVPVAVAAAVAAAGGDVITDPGLQFDSATQGVVPASGGGTTNFLRADGTWAPAVGAAPQVAVLAKSNQTLVSVGDAINIPTAATTAAVGDQFIIEGSARFTGVSGGQALAVQLRDVADTTLLQTLFDILGAGGTNQIYFRHLITITAIGPLVGTTGGMAVATGGTPSLDTRAVAANFTGLTAAAFQYRVELAGVVGNCALNNLVMYRVTGP
jgi:hypothetical protein